MEIAGSRAGWTAGFAGYYLLRYLLFIAGYIFVFVDPDKNHNNSSTMALVNIFLVVNNGNLLSFKENEIFLAKTDTVSTSVLLDLTEPFFKISLIKSRYLRSSSFFLT